MKGQYQLAEGPVWIGSKGVWCWVDISAHQVFTKNSRRELMIYQDRKMLTNLIQTISGVFISAENSFFILEDEILDLKCLISHDNEYRCNDGSVGPDGKYWFGTMEKTPSGLNGRLYSMDSKGNLVDQGAEIGIPNSFIWLDERFVLISDSFLQKTFKVELLESGKLDWGNREVWLDLSQTEGTPDGGALDAEGNVWVAVWGDASIHKYSPDAFLLEKIELNALQPTSCAFGGVNMDELLITTATEGMSDEQLRMYPDSGKVMLKKMYVKGRVLPVFDIEV